MKITAKDVALHASVSPATVSMVFRNKPGVSQAVREKVLSVAEELGFEYSSSRKIQHSKMILLVIYKRHGRILSDTPFFENLIQGVSNEAFRLGYHLSITYFYRGENIKEQLRSIDSAQYAGIILLATEMHSEDMKLFSSIQAPILTLDNWFPLLRHNSVVIDNYMGALTATTYLIHKGHERIGYLHSKVNIRNFRERRDGYFAAIRSMNKTDVDSTKRVILVGSSMESAYNDMSQYLQGDPVLPTAFFADNDIIATGCVRALTKAGYRIPEEISVIGFDNEPVSLLMDAPLTTMDVPKGYMGALAIDKLDQMLRQNGSGEITRTCVYPSLVERKSVDNA